MPAHLCDVCLSSIPSFWTNQLKDELSVSLQPLASMQITADQGCGLCQILLRVPRRVDISKQDFGGSNLTLRRTEGENDFYLEVDGELVATAFLFRVPEPWSTSYTPLGVNENIDNIQIMRTWNEECTRKHVECCTVPSEARTFLPTRLLDLEAHGFGTDIRLVDEESLQDQHANSYPDYITLSHCWGPPDRHPITTTKHNIVQRQTRIPFDELSATFRDAVDITRALGRQYLWIDSLCIIQDDEEDWAWEAGLMSEVYGNSYCTLSALSSEDSTCGCTLTPDLQRKVGPFLDLDAGAEEDIVRGHGCRIRIFPHKLRHWHAEYGDDYEFRYLGHPNAPLNSRGWVLQERMLSRKLIHFSKYQMLWECRKLKATAQLPWADNAIVLRGVTEVLSQLGVRGRWFKLVEDYSSRSLTKDTDKLPAFSGLAKYYQQLIPKGKYHAGIWSVHLPSALLWFSVQQKPNGWKVKDTNRYASYIAPSWSWASVAGMVSYDAQRKYEGSGQDVIKQFGFDNIKVNEISTVSRYSDGYGAIDRASLVLRHARLASVGLKEARQLRGITQPVLVRRGDIVGVFYPDTSLYEEESTEVKMMCLWIVTESYPQLSKPKELYIGQEIESGELVIGLLLVEDKQSQNQFRRIGLARWVKRSIFKDSTTAIITIV